MRLRGYDDYPVTLGDEMRGQRASLGKTLLDAEFDLRIKVKVLRAIEDCDLEGFPNMSVVAGYVRSYARYLGMDTDDTYRRFCAESGYRSPTAGLGGPASYQAAAGQVAAGQVAAGQAMLAGAASGADLTRSRFAVRPAPARLGARVSLGALTSALALVGLIAGLGYGGYALLQDIQRVGFAPLPQGPEIVADAPLIAPPPVEAPLAARPDAAAYEGDGVLLAAAPAELPPPVLPARDGPISAIDPATSGLFAPARAAAAERAAEPSAGGGGLSGSRSPDGPNGGMRITLSPEEAELAEPLLAAALPPAPPRVVLHATAEAWIRVRDGEAVIFEGTLPPGGQYEVPGRVGTPLLRAGNAGALYVLVNGAPYGPVGSSAAVLKNLSLRAEDITGHMPAASAAAIPAGPDGEPLRRAEASMAQ
ncbi:MAG TPA: RodZ domain-containing protein [Thermohalobaculum sp.]|nr:RodZ domain-containing protein [Thermohalobaculum sp.]